MTDRSGGEGDGLTVRAVVLGVGIGAVLTAITLYSVLNVGMSVGGSLLAVLFARALTIRRPLSLLETNTVQTMASGAATMAVGGAFGTVVSALVMVGAPLDTVQLSVWMLAVMGFGACLAAALRRRVLSDPHLRFPGGTAAAEAIRATGAGDGVAPKRRLLLVAAAVAALLPVGKSWVAPSQGAPPSACSPGASTPEGHRRASPSSVRRPAAMTDGSVSAAQPQPASLEDGGSTPGDSPEHEGPGLALAALLFVLALLSPLAAGIGGLVGQRVAFSMLFGAGLAHLVLGPAVVERCFVGKATDWLVWPAVGFMLGSGLTRLWLGLRALGKRAWRAGGSNAAPQRESAGDTDDDLPRRWWVVGLTVAVGAMCFAGWFSFGMPWWLTLAALALSSVFSLMSIQMLGETGVNVVGSFAKLTMLAGGPFTGPGVASTLPPAAITAGSISQACDMMEDLKTGQLLGASPRKQFIAQLIGAAAGGCVAVPLFQLLASQSADFCPPHAQAYRVFAEVVAGTATTPPHAALATLVALCVSAAWALGDRRERWRGKLPHGVAVGVAFLLSWETAAGVAVGALAFGLARRRGATESSVLVISAGFIVGSVVSDVLMLSWRVLGP